MNQETILNLLALLAAMTPISLLASLNIPKIFLKLNNRLTKTTAVCTTVTGVLTKEPVEVKTIFFDKYKANAAVNVVDDNHFRVLDIQSKLENQIRKTELQKDFSMNLMAITTVICHYSKLQNVEEITANLFKSCAIDMKKIQEDYQIITKMPSSEEKKFSTVVSMNGKTKEICAYSKGNPYSILEKCTRELINGKKVEIDHQRRHKLKKRIEKMNKRGQKVIAFAYKALPIKRLEHYGENFIENDFVLVGFIGLVESINSELIPYIEEIKKNNIKIYILTGVKEKKAVAIATALKIINPNHFESISGNEISEMDETKLSKILSIKEKDYLFYQVNEEHRHKIMQTLEKNGEIVTFANKKHGHSIKELLEQIDKSRKNKKNRGKLIAHAINAKIIELSLILTALFLQAPLPISFILILALDILINIILELALNTDRNQENQVINVYKAFNPKILINAITGALIVIGVYFWNLLRFGWMPGESINLNSQIYSNSLSITFILLVIIQIITAFEIRYKEKNIFKTKPFSNIYLILSAIICLLVLRAVTTYQPIEKFLGLSDLSNADWQVILFSSFVFILIIEIYKTIIRHLPKISDVPTNKNSNSTSEIPPHQSDSEKL